MYLYMKKNHLILHRKIAKTLIFNITRFVDFLFGYDDGVCESCFTAGLFRWSNVSRWEMS